MKFFSLMIKSHFPILLIFILFSCGGGGSSGSSNGTANGNAVGTGVSIGGSTNPGSSAGDSGTPGGNNDTPNPGPAPDLGDNGDDANPGNNGGSGGNTPTASLNPTNNGNTLDFTFVDTTSTASGSNIITLSLDNTTSFQAITEKFGQNIFSTLKDEDGASLVSILSPPNSFAPFSNTNVNSLSFPVDANQTSVDSGDYKLEVGMAVNTDFRTLLIAKHDSNLNVGTVFVNFFMVGTATQGYINDIQDAINIFSVIFSQVGITVIPTLTSLSSSTGILPNPSSGSSFYSTNSEHLAINIYLGINVSATASTGGGNTLDVLGLVHSIPGPFLKSTASAVAISMESHYGVDSVFSAFEVGLLGETMAHESGHYLGLFHPVEFGDATHTTFVPGDRLSDTIQCSTIADCNGTGLSQNLMFPTPVVGVLQQRALSAQQKALLNLATIVD